MSGTIGSTVLDLNTASALTGAEAVYVVQNGQDRQTTTGAIGQLARSSVPSASLLGGAGGTLVGVAVGTGLSLSVSGTLTATGVLAATSTAPGVAVSLNTGTLALTPGTIAGASFIGVLGTASAAASVSPIASLPFLSKASIEPGGTFNTVTVSTAGQVTAGSNAAYLLNNQTVTLSGDITGAGTTSIVATLPSILAAGTFNLGTFNAKGQITAGQSIAYLTGNQTITLSGDIIGSGTTAIAGTLASLWAGGSFGSASIIPTVTVNAKGLVTAVGTAAVSATVSANLGVVFNSGTVQINNVVTVVGTNAGTTTIAPGSGTSDVVLTMPVTAGTVTLAAAPTFKRQRAILDIVFGATISTPSLNTGFVFPASGGPTSYAPGTVVNQIDRLMLMSPDGTKWAVMSIEQGWTV